MGREDAWFSSYFKVYATLLALFAIAVSTFLIYFFSQQILTVDILPGLHILYTELFLTSLLLPLSVVVFILSSRRRQLLQCSGGKLTLVEVAGLVINFLSIGALVAGTALSWSAANTINGSYQVLYHPHTEVVGMLLLEVENPLCEGTGQLFLLSGSSSNPGPHLDDLQLQ